MMFKFLLGILLGLIVAFILIYLRRRAIDKAIEEMKDSEEPCPIKYVGQDLFNFIVRLIHRYKL